MVVTVVDNEFQKFSFLNIIARSVFQFISDVEFEKKLPDFSLEIGIQWNYKLRGFAKKIM